MDVPEVSHMADPCLSCTLPDCDDRSPACPVRRLRRSYYNKLEHGQEHLITGEERAASNRFHEIWRYERAAEASEGGRTFRRGSTVYGGNAHG